MGNIRFFLFSCITGRCPLFRSTGKEGSCYGGRNNAAPDQTGHFPAGRIAGFTHRFRKGSISHILLFSPVSLTVKKILPPFRMHGCGEGTFTRVPGLFIQAVEVENRQVSRLFLLWRTGRDGKSEQARLNGQRRADCKACPGRANETGSGMNQPSAPGRTSVKQQGGFPISRCVQPGRLPEPYPFRPA